MSSAVSLGIRLLTQLTAKEEEMVNLSVLEMKANWGNRGKAPFLLNFRVRHIE
jgi:hypothetical protein